MVIERVSTRGPLRALRATARKRGAARRAGRVIAAMSDAVGVAAVPSVSRIAREKRDPFKILVSTVISLRTKDEVTMEASKRLFRMGSTPRGVARLPVRAIERAIYPAGFYRTKARTIKNIARQVSDEHGGRVPDTIDGLLAFKGVGRKTAALVVSLGYGKDAICVDTHVHRISNRIGLVSTNTPAATESDLMGILPRKYWIGYNELLVSFGQQICTPVSPHCSTCPVTRACERVGVERHR
jgi:endonuclease-3